FDKSNPVKNGVTPMTKEATMKRFSSADRFSSASKMSFEVDAEGFEDEDYYRPVRRNLEFEQADENDESRTDESDDENNSGNRSDDEELEMEQFEESIYELKQSESGSPTKAVSDDEEQIDTTSSTKSVDKIV